MNGIFAGIAAIIGLCLHWSVPASWRNSVLLATSLLVGAALWSEATLVAIVLVGIQILPIQSARGWHKWIIVSALLSPMIYQKIWNAPIVGLSYVSFLALALYLDSLKSSQRVSWLSRMQVGLFFPIIPAGPIERWSNLGPQYAGPRAFNRSLFISGLFLIAFGLFKKVVVADRLSELVVDPQKNFLSYWGPDMWSYLGLCLLRIYADFSAITDIARGTCRLFGIEVMDNFDRPYLADSVQDIWRRWHISLVSWLRETVYNPIAVRTRSVTLASAAVLFLVGLWHGIKWQMVVWALYWLLLFWVAVLFRTKGWRIGLPIFVRRALCIIAMAFSTVFMIPETLSDLVTVISSSFFFGSAAVVDQKALMISQWDLRIVLVGFFLILVVEKFSVDLAIKYQVARPMVPFKAQAISAGLILFFLFLTVAFGVSRWENFVYMRY